MDPKEAWDWGFKAVMVVGWIVATTTTWNKLVEKINGQGKRITAVEHKQAQEEGKSSITQHEVSEYRHDVQNVVATLARIEKASEQASEKHEQNNLQFGSQLYNIEKLINEKDGRNRERLVVLETVAKIEKKVGPIPLD